jgi:two-component system, NtrC family, sensor kinase
MKTVYIILLFLTSVFSDAFGQEPVIDSLKKLLVETNQDSSRVLLLIKLASEYQFFKLDTAMMLAHQAIDLAQQLHFAKGEIRALTRLGEVLRIRGEFPQALEANLRGLQLSRQTDNLEEEAGTLSFAAIIYIELGEYRQGLNCLFQSKKIYENIYPSFISFRLTNIGDAYEKMNILDSALYFQRQALASSMLHLSYSNSQPLRALILTRLGIVQNDLGNTSKALSYYQEALQTANASNDLLNRARSQYEIAEVYHILNQSDSGLHYAQLAFKDAQRVTQKTMLLSASSLLAQFFKDNKILDSAYYYQQIAMEIKDSLFGSDKFRRLQLLALNEQQRIQQLREQQERSKVNIQRTSLLLILSVFLLIAIFLWRNNRLQQHTNRTLNQKNKEIEKQRNMLEQTLTELKAAQAQLVQQEKMASLGELTAGIAHEIQNPLNFVNNFSEVNKELIDEASQAIKSGNTNDAIELLSSLRDNEDKISNHGQRADSIVKGMLQHSRTSSGQKEPTDINALADEYLRLSYHGLRAKDKSFNATLQTDFDPTIGKINIISQDIGRVLLNLYNNSFYTVTEKKKQQPEEYEPAVSVTTKRIGEKVLISVKDNGGGIPQKIIDKIFQPFFTTKPTGQGTGLGLSLSYDIIKAHGGELKVESKEGDGAEFVVLIPVA